MTQTPEEQVALGVSSEVGRLRSVILHRPGLELSRLTPDNIGDLLFDDVMWAKKAKEEHDAFAESLRDKGVRVHYFGQMLAETLDMHEARDFVLDRVCTEEILGPTLVRAVGGSSRTSTGPRSPSTSSGASSRQTSNRSGLIACAGTPCGPTTSSSHRCPTTCSSGTTRAGSTAG